MMSMSEILKSDSKFGCGVESGAIILAPRLTIEMIVDGRTIEIVGHRSFTTGTDGCACKQLKRIANMAASVIAVVLVAFAAPSLRLLLRLLLRLSMRLLLRLSMRLLMRLFNAVVAAAMTAVDTAAI